MKVMMMNTPDTRTWFEHIPKVELHVHLEGAIPYDTLWELVQKYGGDSSTPDQQALIRRFEYTDFAHFIETWVWKNQFIRDYDDFSLIAEAVARDFAGQQIRYAEVFYSPPDFARHGLQTQPITEAIRRGLNKVPEIEIALVADLVRDFGAEQGARVLSELAELQSLGVIGVGIGGSEQIVPPEVFEEVFEQARRLGFRTSAHAGEAAGAESVWGAICSLHVDRIGHGVRAVEDDSLVDYLAEHKIPIELCPLSNVCTGAMESYAQHPVRRYFERGIPISINTDDPKMFGNSLAEEYRLLTEQHGFSYTEIQQLITGAIDTSWLDAARKQHMKLSFSQDPAWSI